MSAVIDSPPIETIASESVASPPTPGAILPFVQPAQVKHRKLRVGIILEQTFPGNERVECVAKTLVEGGYEVHLLCVMPPLDGITPNRVAREDYYQGVYIHRINTDDVTHPVPWQKQPSRLFYDGLFQGISSRLWNRDNLWHTVIERFVQFYGLDLLHVQHLRLLDTALNAAQKYNCPVIADFPEHEPETLAMKASMPSYKSKLFEDNSLSRWEEIEERGIDQAVAVFVGTEEAKERLVRNGAPANKITALKNTFDIEKYAAIPPSADILRQFKPWFLMTYAGNLQGDHQGIATVLEALSILKPEIPELYFVAAGELKGHYRQTLQGLVEKYGLEQRVHFTGYGHTDDVASDLVHYIEASDLCLLPHLACEINHTTFPQAAYLYHLFKKPIIASECKAIERYVRKTHGGLTYPSGNADELANQIRRLYYDTELKKVMGENGQHAVLNEHHWQKHANSLLVAYQNVVDEFALSRA